MPSDQPGKRVGDILNAIIRIEAYVRDVGGIDALMRDEFVHRDAVERQILIISEAATKLRGHVETLEPGIDWHAIRGIGNYIRHNYDGVQDEVIRRVLTSELKPLAEACERLGLGFESDESVPLEHHTPNAETRAAMAETDAMIKSGKLGFKTADEFFASLDSDDEG